MSQTRKVIQISAVPVNGWAPRLIALCDDGTIWVKDNSRDWRKEKEIPQT